MRTHLSALVFFLLFASYSCQVSLSLHENFCVLCEAFGKSIERRGSGYAEVVMDVSDRFYSACVTMRQTEAAFYTPPYRAKCVVGDRAAVIAQYYRSTFPESCYSPVFGCVMTESEEHMKQVENAILQLEQLTACDRCIMIVQGAYDSFKAQDKIPIWQTKASSICELIAFFSGEYCNGRVKGIVKQLLTPNPKATCQKLGFCPPDALVT